ncbi:MAG: hypothetical protein J1E39_07305 [Eubacterium sp.]|nr:hypothetical protein [Eubacterium sp.]
MQQCRRCLTAQLSEEAFRTVSEYVSLIPKDKKTDDVSYHKRLEKCRACDELINGMCAKCGCFAEIRAAYAHRACPHEQPRW